MQDGWSSRLQQVTLCNTVDSWWQNLVQKQTGMNTLCQTDVSQKNAHEITLATSSPSDFEVSSTFKTSAIWPVMSTIHSHQNTCKVCLHNFEWETKGFINECKIFIINNVSWLTPILSKSINPDITASSLVVGVVYCLDRPVTGASRLCIFTATLEVSASCDHSAALLHLPSTVCHCVHTRDSISLQTLLSEWLWWAIGILSESCRFAYLVKWL